jgi:hypothetical protein
MRKIALLSTLVVVTVIAALSEASVIQVREVGGTLGASICLTWSGRTVICAPADGQLTISNNAGTNGPVSLTGPQPTTDVAPTVMHYGGTNGYSQAATNTAGGTVILSSGIGRRLFTCLDIGSGVAAVTITANATAAQTFTSGTQFVYGASTTTCATNLATAINANSTVNTLLTAVASTTFVYLVPTPLLYSLKLGVSQALRISKTAGADGEIVIAGSPDGSGTAVQGVSINTGSGDVRFQLPSASSTYLGLRELTSNSTSTAKYAVSVSGTAGGMMVGSTGGYYVTSSASGEGATADTGWERSAASIWKPTNGSNGNGDVQLPASSLTTGGTMTVGSTAIARSVYSKYSWTNAMIVALGASLTGDITIATLPAKTVVRNVNVVIDTVCAGTTTLTISVGYTAAAYSDYLFLVSLQGTANTVYGDESGERQAGLNGYNMPSYTGTTPIIAHFISTVSNLSAVTNCTGTIYLETATLP